MPVRRAACVSSALIMRMIGASSSDSSKSSISGMSCISRDKVDFAFHFAHDLRCAAVVARVRRIDRRGKFGHRQAHDGKCAEITGRLRRVRRRWFYR